MSLDVTRLLDKDVDTDLKLSAVSILIAKAVNAVNGKVAALEERQLQKGDKGDRGEKGDKGDPGIQGARGEAGARGEQGLKGEKGQKGDPGKDGLPGKDGVSVVDAEIDAMGSLIITLSNGKVIDVGDVMATGRSGSVFVSGNAYQVTVSDTPPSNPQLNDLWFDIS